MTSPRLRILSQFGDVDALQLPADLRERVEVSFVPPSQPVPADVRGDVLLMVHSGAPAIYELVERGVRWVHFVGTGVNAYDLPRLTRGGRIFTNSRGSVAVPISEYVLAALLFHEKRLSELFVHTAPEHWPSRMALGTLHGRQLALLGFGAIGGAVAQRALPFGARVRALRNTSALSPIEGVEVVRTFEALVADADHLILAAPLTPSTRHIVNAESLAKVKPGLHVINVARGELIDQDALRAALDNGTLSGATLDAVTPEPLPAGHWMYEHPRVRVSPHHSWNWPHAHETVARMFADNLRRYLNAEPLDNVVDPDVGY